LKKNNTDFPIIFVLLVKYIEQCSLKYSRFYFSITKRESENCTPSLVKLIIKNI